MKDTEDRSELDGLVENLAARIYMHRHGSEWIRMFDLTGGKVEELSQLQVSKERSFMYNAGFTYTVVEYEPENLMMYEIKVGSHVHSWILKELSERLVSESEYIFESARAMIDLVNRTLTNTVLDELGGSFEEIESMISYARHRHLGNHIDDECGDCGHDLRHPIHLRKHE